MKKVVMKIGQPNINGRIYPKEVVEKAIEECQKREMLGAYPNSNETEIPVKKIAFKVSSLNIEKNELIADIEILETPAGKALKVLQDMVYVTIGVGTIKDGIVQDDFKLTGFSAVLHSDSSWEN